MARKVGFYNQLWVSHFPKNEKDVYSVLAALKDEQFGIFQDGSDFSGSFDLFEVEGTAHDFKIKMLQTDKKFEFNVEIKPDKSSDFEYSLKIVSGNVPRGPKVYYTLEEWEVGNNSQLVSAINNFKALSSK